VTPAAFRRALLAIPPGERDGWLDQLLGLGDAPDDGPDLPRGCVPYLPSPVDALLRVVDLAAIEASDVVVDVGAGMGRAAAFLHLATGASVVALEIQRALVRAARALTTRLALERITIVEGDVAALGRDLGGGTVFFLYCPFSGERLDRLVDALAPVARTRELRVCALDLPLPSRPWLAPMASGPGDLTVHRTVAHGSHRAT